MALDDFIINSFGAIRGHLLTSGTRWTGVANAARDETLTPLALFEAFRDQFTANWNIWLDVSGFPGSPVIPTVSIHGKWDSLTGKRDKVVSAQRLAPYAAIDFQGSSLQELGGTNVIAAPAVTASLTGDLYGEILVKMTKDAPAAGHYHGVLMVRLKASEPYRPVAWLVVEATP